jgi:hypothetical protein
MKKCILRNNAGINRNISFAQRNGASELTTSAESNVILSLLHKLQYFANGLHGEGNWFRSFIAARLR